MEENSLEFDVEQRYLNQVILEAKEQLAQLLQDQEKSKSAILTARREMKDEFSHAVPNLYAISDFHDLVMLSQEMKSVSQQLSQYSSEDVEIRKLTLLTQNPYFARIDFRFEDEDSADLIYIGRSSLTDPQTHRIYVYDWRSPIASVFYQYGTGAASYEAPMGRIEGEVERKRQYEIHQGALEYYFEANVQIVDEFLRKLLAQNTSSSMKSIVETIQADQDRIIRDQNHDLVLVQGTAGSGKTSVALHRAAYLMYQGLTSRLSHSNIMILSPNPIFAQYISQVLPDLGEENVQSLILDDWIAQCYPSQSIEKRTQYLERLVSSQDPAFTKLLKEQYTFKTSDIFCRILDRYVQEIPKHCLPFADIYYNGTQIASKEQLLLRIQTEKKDAPLAVRLKHLEASLWEEIHAQHNKRMKKLTTYAAKYQEQKSDIQEHARLLSIYECAALDRQIRSFTELDPLKLYQTLFRNPAYFLHLLPKTLQLDADLITELIQATKHQLNQPVLPYEDSAPLAYLYVKLCGYMEYRSIMQVIVDEAQDYEPLQYELLHQLFPRSRYTILGDIYQSIGKSANENLYQQVIKALTPRNPAKITMDKSFRCTSEILNYSRRFLDSSTSITSFSRSGDVPQALSADNWEAHKANILSEIELCQSRNYHSIALLCKTEANCRELYDHLHDTINLTIVQNNTETTLSNVFIIPVYLSKGLEFDAVLLCDASHQNYQTPDDQNLLYISSTRALHRLTLFYQNQASEFLCTNL